MKKQSVVATCLVIVGMFLAGCAITAGTGTSSGGFAGIEQVLGTLRVDGRITALLEYSTTAAAIGAAMENRRGGSVQRMIEGIDSRNLSATLLRQVKWYMSQGPDTSQIVLVVRSQTDPHLMERIIKNSEENTVGQIRITVAAGKSELIPVTWCKYDWCEIGISDANVVRGIRIRRSMLPGVGSNPTKAQDTTSGK